MRRISEALDAPGGLEADASLTAALEADAEAREYAAGVRRVDAALGLFGESGAGMTGGADWDTRVDWEAMASRIDAQIDAMPALEDIGDPTAPPVFEDVETERFVAAAEGVAFEAAPPRVEPVLVGARSATPPAPVVDLASRRRQRNMWIASVGGLAAAAAVALGLTAGMSLDGDLQAESAPAGDAPASAVAAAPESPTEEDESLDMGYQASEQRTQTVAANDPAPFAADLAEGSTSQAGGVAWGRTESRRRRRSAARPMARAAGGALGLSGSTSTPRPTGAVHGAAIEPGAPVDNAWANEPSPEPTARPPAPAPRLAPSTARGAAGGAPDEGAARAALASVTDQVRRCMGPDREVARIRVQVDANGRVRHAEVQPPFTGSAAACMVAAVRSVRMPTGPASGYEIGHAYRPQPVAGSPRGGRAVGAAHRARRAAPAPRPSTLSDPF
ncbi:MAG: hypothetical protein AB8I08_30795 [Sandaracinaceae bacterium]